MRPLRILITTFARYLLEISESSLFTPSFTYGYKILWHLSLTCTILCSKWTLERAKNIVEEHYTFFILPEVNGVRAPSNFSFYFRNSEQVVVR